MLNWPCPSVTAMRTFSISAGLAASTVTPGRTAPVVSSHDAGDAGLRLRPRDLRNQQAREAEHYTSQSVHRPSSDRFQL